MLNVATGVVGLAAVGIAAVGAVGSTSSPAVGNEAGVPQVQLAGNTGIAASALLSREVRLSRDSSRQALGDATGAKPGAPRSGQAQEQNAGIKKLAASAEKTAAQLAKDAWQLPVSGYRLTARFGQCSGLWAHCHTGLDFAAPSGTPIRAVANGVVGETGWAGAYGNRTVITLEDGTELWYCHQSSIGVQPGQRVIAGQTIGLVGATGNTTGPHLHLEVRPGGGDPIDPYEALIAHGVTP